MLNQSNKKPVTAQPINNITNEPIILKYWLTNDISNLVKIKNNNIVIHKRNNAS